MLVESYYYLNILLSQFDLMKAYRAWKNHYHSPLLPVDQLQSWRIPLIHPIPYQLTENDFQELGWVQGCFHNARKESGLFLTTVIATPNQLAEAEAPLKTLQDKIQVMHWYDTEIELLLDDDQLSQDMELSTQFLHNASVAVARLSAPIDNYKRASEIRGNSSSTSSNDRSLISSRLKLPFFNFHHLQVRLRIGWASPTFSKHQSTPTFNYRSLRSWITWRLVSREGQSSCKAQLRSLIITTKSLGNFCTNAMRTSGAL